MGCVVRELTLVHGRSLLVQQKNSQVAQYVHLANLQILPVHQELLKMEEYQRMEELKQHFLPMLPCCECLVSHKRQLLGQECHWPRLVFLDAALPCALWHPHLYVTSHALRGCSPTQDYVYLRLRESLPYNEDLLAGPCLPR